MSLQIDQLKNIARKNVRYGKKASGMSILDSHHAKTNIVIGEAGEARVEDALLSAKSRKEPGLSIPIQTNAVKFYAGATRPMTHGGERKELSRARKPSAEKLGLMGAGRGIFKFLGPSRKGSLVEKGKHK